MDDGSKPGKPKFDFESAEPKPAAPDFDWSSPGSDQSSPPEPIPSLHDVPTPPGQLQRPPERKRGNTVSDLYAVARKSNSGRFILALATAATIVGGVAASVQLYDYFVKPKPGPYAPRTTTGGGGGGGKPTEPSIDETPVIQAGAHFRIKAPNTWMVVDRTTYESTIRMVSPNTPSVGSTSAYVTDIQYLIRTSNGTSDGVSSCQLHLMENPTGLTMDDYHQQMLRLRNGENGGFMDPGRLIKVEGVEIVETASGETIRAICSMANQSDPTTITSVLNYFFCIRKDATWFAMFYSDVGTELQASPMILDMAKSIEVYD